MIGSAHLSSERDAGRRSSAAWPIRWPIA